MLERDLEFYGPGCPTCRTAGRASRELTLASGLAGEDGDIASGILRCPDERCLREHPIIDGVPIVVPDLRTWATHQLDAVLRRRDLDLDLATLLGDAAGPDSPHERDRMTLSTYAAAHWGDLQDGGSLERESTAAAVAGAAIELLADRAEGPVLDFGCGPGRAAFELAAADDSGIAGIDLNFEMLRIAREISTTGGSTYLQRRLGLVYEQRSVWAGFLRNANAAFFCADVLSLPFGDARFGGGMSLNVLDSVSSPLGHLQEAARVIRPGGVLVLATPYEWTAAATPVGQWLGGHSQRGPARGASEETMRQAFAPGAAFGRQMGWVIEDERDDVPWRLSSHERAVVEYRLHMVRLRRLATP